jgi:hypothetical protein
MCQNIPQRCQHLLVVDRLSTVKYVAGSLSLLICDRFYPVFACQSNANPHECVIGHVIGRVR